MKELFSFVAWIAFAIAVLLAIGAWAQNYNTSTGRSYGANGSILSGTTGSIGGGALLVGASASGTVSIAGATTGMACVAQASDGTNMAALGASTMCTVTASGVATVNVVAVIALTPAAKTYIVRVIP